MRERPIKSTRPPKNTRSRLRTKRWFQQAKSQEPNKTKKTKVEHDVPARETVTGECRKHSHLARQRARTLNQILYQQIDRCGNNCRQERHDGLPMQAKAIKQQDDQPSDDHDLWIETRPTDQAHQQRKGWEMNQLDSSCDLKIKRKKRRSLDQKSQNSKSTRDEDQRDPEQHGSIAGNWRRCTLGTRRQACCRCNLTVALIRLSRNQYTPVQRPQIATARESGRRHPGPRTRAPPCLPQGW